ncbi:MAG: hypothetical protein WA840_15960 [Caulobacteraceae bacterium]
MHIDGWTLALQAINVLVLIWLLSRFLYRPVMAAIAARQAEAGKLLAEAQAAKDQAAADTAALKGRIEGLQAEAETLRAKAEADAQAACKALLDQATKEAAGAKAQAQAALVVERTAAALQLDHDAARLAVAIAEKLLHRIPSQAAADALFQALLDSLGALPEAAREQLATTDEPLEIVTAELLPPTDQAKRRAALLALLPSTPTISFRNDPALIAGFELHGPHTLIVNSWRADLERVTRELGASAGASRAA